MSRERYTTLLVIISSLVILVTCAIWAIAVN